MKVTTMYYYSQDSDGQGEDIILLTQTLLPFSEDSEVLPHLEPLYYLQLVLKQ